VSVQYFEDLSPIDSRITSVEKSISEIQNTGGQVNKKVQQFSKQNEEIANQISNLTSRINQLVSNNTQLQGQIEDMKVAMHKGPHLPQTENLQMEVNSMSETTTACSQKDVASPTQVSQTNATLTILEELADRERRRSNLIVYNLAESESQSDESILLELCSSVFNLNVALTKTIRLGRRNDSKPRPVLACFADVNIRNAILSFSGKMRKYDKYKATYIVPDRTVLERQKHHKLVEELKRRRSNGEQNLVIRNGSIISL